MPSDYVDRIRKPVTCFESSCTYVAEVFNLKMRHFIDELLCEGKLPVRTQSTEVVELYFLVLLLLLVSYVWINYVHKGLL